MGTLAGAGHSRGALSAELAAVEYKNPRQWLQSMSVRIPSEEPTVPPEIAPPPPVAPPAGISQGDPEVSGDIPTQIQGLAELRDSGALTEEEFAAKKQDLLSRM